VFPLFFNSVMEQLNIQREVWCLTYSYNNDTHTHAYTLILIAHYSSLSPQNALWALNCGPNQETNYKKISWKKKLIYLSKKEKKKRSTPMLSASSRSSACDVRETHKDESHSRDLTDLNKKRRSNVLLVGALYTSLFPANKKKRIRDERNRARGQEQDVVTQHIASLNKVSQHSPKFQYWLASH
jgi:hypothetical protein